MDKFMKQVKTFWQEEDGLSAVEYVVAGSLIVAGLAGAFSALGTAIEEGVGDITDCVTGEDSCVSGTTTTTTTPQ